MFKKIKLSFITFLSIAIIFSSISFPKFNAHAAGAQFKVINTNSLNLRSGASINYKIIAKLKKNTIVTKTATKGSWSKVTVGKKTGYVSSTYLKKVVKKVSNTSPSKKIGYYYSINAASLNVRKTSSSTSTKLSVVRFGSQFIIKDVAKNGWYKIEYAQGKTGWVSHAYGYTTIRKDNVYPKGTIFGPLSGRIITVDAGHGGSQPGAQYFGVDEKDINLRAARILRDELVKKGAKVVMTRNSDTTLSLERRVAISKAAKSDAFISVHHNVYNKPSEKGYLALYSKQSEKTFTRYLFNGIERPVSQVTDVPAEEYRYQSLYVLRENSIIGTLVEYGYMNRESEFKKVNTDSYRIAMAQGITNGVINYFNKY